MISQKDSEKVLSVMLKFVPVEKFPALIRALKEIKGNQSYRDTIAKIEALHKVDPLDCPRCNVKKRPEGGHRCGDCGEDI